MFRTNKNKFDSCIPSNKIRSPFTAAFQIWSTINHCKSSLSTHEAGMDEQRASDWTQTHEAWKRRKQRQVTQKKHRATLPLYRNEVRKTKADPELKFVRDVKGNRKGFYKRRQGKTWVHCWIGQGTRWQTTQKRPRYSIHPLPQCLLVRLTFRNPRPTKPEERSKVRKISLSKGGPGQG